MQHHELYSSVWHDHEKCWDITTPKALQKQTVLYMSKKENLLWIQIWEKELHGSVKIKKYLKRKLWSAFTQNRVFEKQKQIGSKKWAQRTNINYYATSHLQISCRQQELEVQIVQSNTTQLRWQLILSSNQGETKIPNMH